MHASAVDLRQRVVRADEHGEGSMAELADRFGVCTAFGKKRLRQGRALGDLRPLPQGGGKPASWPARPRQLLQRPVRQPPDISVAERQRLLAEHANGQVPVSPISRARSTRGRPLTKRACRQVSATMTSAPGTGDASPGLITGDGASALRLGASWP
jgi:transposase